MKLVGGQNSTAAGINNVFFQFISDEITPGFCLQNNLVMTQNKQWTLTNDSIHGDLIFTLNFTLILLKKNWLTFLQPNSSPKHQKSGTHAHTYNKYCCTE